MLLWPPLSYILRSASVSVRNVEDVVYRFEIFFNATYPGNSTGEDGTKKLSVLGAEKWRKKISEKVFCHHQTDDTWLVPSNK